MHQNCKHIFLRFEPPRGKTNKMTAHSEDSDQPGHPPSLIRVFAGHPPSLIRVFAVRSKVVNRDWVNHKACSLSHYIHVVPGSFVTNGYFSKLIRKSKHSVQYFKLCSVSYKNANLCRVRRLLLSHMKGSVDI